MNKCLKFKAVRVINFTDINKIILSLRHCMAHNLNHSLLILIRDYLILNNKYIRNLMKQ